MENIAGPEPSGKSENLCNEMLSKIKGIFFSLYCIPNNYTSQIAN